MKYLNLTKGIVLAAIITGIFASCEKVVKVDGIGDRGPTLVKIIGGGTDSVPGTKLKSIDFIPTSQSFLALDLRRDCANQSDLNKTMTVTLSDDTNALNIINDELINTGLTPYEYLPDSLYELDPALTKTGDKGGFYTLTMAPGEFAKEINLVIPDATKLNATAKYALPFTVKSVDANGTISSNRSLVIVLGAKNKYDGVYEVTGSFLDAANATFTAAYPKEYHLITTGPNSVIVTEEYDAGIFYPLYSFTTPSGGSLYGNFGLSVTFDPATDEIIDMHNYYGDPSNPANSVGNPALGSGAPDYSAAPPRLRRAVLDNNGTYGYDAQTKKVNAKYYMLQFDLNLPGNIRCTMDEIWTYTGPRP